MGFKAFLSIVSVLAIFALLFLYIFPLGSIDFSGKPYNSNFSLSNNESMQFYSHLRYRTENISYYISNCKMQKKENMEQAFSILENLTILKFIPNETNLELTVSCEDKVIEDNGMFIAGEGGVVNVTISGKFNIVSKGEILLLRKSNCERPNIAIHELLHALGFKHSLNKDNIMYNVTECSQTISQDIIDEINRLYSIPSYPDLSFENASGSLTGRFLEVNISIMNYGLQDAYNAELFIYSDKNLVKQMNLSSLKAGAGRMLTITNIFVSQINVNNISLEIKYPFDELDKENNKITLEIKK